MATELDLPVDLSNATQQKPTGFGTPTKVKAGQKAHFLPTRVIPVVFVPGIMGSNLKITSADRLRLLKRDPSKADANIAWRPDSIGVTNVSENANLTPAQRQLILDPNTTAVDVYNPHSTAPSRDGDGRHGNVDLNWSFSSPLMRDDPSGKPGGMTAEQKARARGWSQPFFDSYGDLLQTLESRLNRVFAVAGRGRGSQLVSDWQDVVGVDPKEWMLDKATPQKAMTEAEIRQAATNCWFPVFAVGYNWLESNGASAKAVATQIKTIHKKFVEAEFDCKGVIVVTHSMGGLVGRALLHPDFGGINDLVLGIVHGVQPAIGAAAAYKRIRAGFDGTGLADKIAGHTGELVTAVLANSPGGLQLLPSKAYGNGWMQVEVGGKVISALPAHGDPYEEIYKLRGKWYGLFPHEKWINPCGLPEDKGGGTFARTMTYVDKAKTFHDAIVGTYHARTYAHYGADKQRRAFGTVRWDISASCGNPARWQQWPILQDSNRGVLELVRYDNAKGASNPDFSKPLVAGASLLPITATLMPADEAGDETVPMRSADHQLHQGKCKAVFRQAGYEHQKSYGNDKAVAATLYSIMRIAQEVNT